MTSKPIRIFEKIVPSDCLKGKRIACLGNMNNSLFALARYLRIRRLEVDIFVPEGLQDYFRPENDIYGPVPDWVHCVPWGLTSRSVLDCVSDYTAILSRYDLIIGHTFAPAICHLAGRPLDIFLPHGGDLYLLPFSPKKTAVPQMRGIQEARLIVMNARPEAYRQALKKVAVEAIYLTLPALYHEEYSPENIARHQHQLVYYEKFKALRSEYEIILFSHSRHLWSKLIDGSDMGKGNDILIKGFAEFCFHTRLRPLLVLFEHGPDVDRSRQLIRELGIEAHIAWFPVMPRKEIMPGLLLADIAADQFICGSFGGVGQEILGMGKPLLVHLDTTTGEDAEINTPPCINVKTPEEICAALTEYERDRARHVLLGQQGKHWYAKYRGEGLADAIIFLMAGLLEGRNAEALRALVYEAMSAPSNLAEPQG